MGLSLRAHLAHKFLFSGNFYKKRNQRQGETEGAAGECGVIEGGRRMAMYRQSGWTERVGLRGGGGCPGDNGGSNSNSNDHHHHHHEGGGPPPDSVSVRVAPHHRVGAAGARNRRSGRSEKALLKLSSRRGLLFILPSLLLIFVTFFAFSILSRDTKGQISSSVVQIDCQLASVILFVPRTFSLSLSCLGLLIDKLRPHRR